MPVRGRGLQDAAAEAAAPVHLPLRGVQAPDGLRVRNVGHLPQVPTAQGRPVGRLCVSSHMRKLGEMFGGGGESETL